jgi:hypothetical protein
MRVGVCTHYSYCDQAYLGVRLIDFLCARGIDFDIYSENQPGKLGLPYDKLVKHKNVMPFTDWAKKQSVIIWTHVPKIEQISFAARYKCRTVLVPMWQELAAPFRKSIRRADVLVALTKEAQELFTNIYRFRNSVFIPYTPGLPLVRKEKTVDPKNVKVFMPWFDKNARCASSDFLGALAYLFERMPDASLKVGIMSSKFSPAIAKFFTTLSSRTNGRVTVVRNVPYLNRIPLYTESDLTLFPAECDNYGFCLLTSISCGTPVLSLAVSPQTDFVYSEANGVLVKTKVDYDEYGVPHALPDYEKLLATLQLLIAEPWHIDKMNQKITYNLVSRRNQFAQGWNDILQI